MRSGCFVVVNLPDARNRQEVSFDVSSLASSLTCNGRNKIENCFQLGSAFSGNLQGHLLIIQASVDVDKVCQCIGERAKTTYVI